MANLYNLPNATAGLDEILIQTLNSSDNMFGITPLLLTFVFFVVFLGGMSRQKARSGNADYSMWLVIASISILMLTLIMSMISGFINTGTLAVVIIITIFSGIWLWFDKSRGES